MLFVFFFEKKVFAKISTFAQKTIYLRKFSLKFTMSNKTTFEVIRSRAANVGLSLRELCKRVDCDDSTLQRWKIKDPKSIMLYRRMLATIEAEEARVRERENSNAE